MNELINYNATLNLGNEKSNLDAVIGSTNSLVPASDKINNINSVNNSVTAKDSATTKDILPSILDLKSEEINNVILPDYSTPKTSIFSNDLTSKSSTSDTGIDSLTGLKVNEAVIDNSKPDSLTNPSASQSQTLNNTEQLKENVTPATSESKTPDTSITSTENKTIAPAIEKPSVSVEETSPVTDKAAVTSESEDKAIAPLETGSTTPVSSEKPVVTTESSSSVTGDAGSIASNTPAKNSDSAVVTNNNSGAIASEVSKSDTPLVTTSQNFTFNMGVFKVDETGKVGIDYLFDGGGYEGELGIFNLDGMENLAQNSDAFITEAARRAVSNSNLGYVVINDATEGARFNGDLPYDIDRNRGEYKGVKTFTMLPGDRFAFILVPNGANLQQVANKSAKGDDARPLFSLPIANPNGSSMTGQIADVTGVGNTFVMEDLRVDKSGTDSDYNDIIFQVRGATGSAVSIDSVINPNKEWRSTNLGKALIEYAKPYVTPENPKVGELVTDELYDSIFGNTDNQVDNPSKTGAIAPEVPKSDSPAVTTAPATSDPAKTESNVTSTNSGAIAPATEKPSVSVVETSPVTDKTAVTSESQNQPLDSVSTTPGSLQQPVVTAESSSSVTEDGGAIASNTSPRNPDSVVVTDNNSGAIAPSNEETPVIDNSSVTSSSSNSTNAGEVKETQNQSSLVVVETVVVTDATQTNSGEEQAIATDKLLVGDNVGAIAVNPTSTTAPNSLTADNSVSNVTGDNRGAIAKATQDTNSASIPQPTVVETSASGDKGEGAIASTTPVTVKEPVVTTRTVVNEWLEKANSQLTQLEASGQQQLQKLQNELSDTGNSIYERVPELWSNLSSNENYINALVDDLGNQISSSGDYLNAWANYLQGEISSTDYSTYNQSGEISQNLSSNTDYLNSLDSYLNSELSDVGNIMYDEATYIASEINRVQDWMYQWTDYNWNEIVRIENWMIDRTHHVVNEFNQYGVGDAAWNEYDALTDNRNSIVNAAETEYYNNVYYANTVRDTVNSNFRYWNDYRIGVMNDAWGEYNNFDSYTDAVINNAWNDYSNLQNYRVEVINQAWNDYNSLTNYQANIIDNAWSEYYALDNYTGAVMADAWNQYQAQDSARYQIMGDAWNQYSAITNSWNDSVDDTQAQIDVWAKIASSEGRWYNTPNNTKSGLPLIGVIDTGFSADNPDIDYSRITLGKDLVGGDGNRLLESGEGWRDHGTKILEIIGATRNNNIGIDGINDKSPLWLGGAVGSNDWAQSLVEFVDAAKASGQPNAVVNLSFDLTETLPDGSVVTRHELTTLERAALTYAQQNNVLVVAATGNQNSLMSALGEATKEFDNILVAGAAEGWQRADYSSYGEIDYANYGKGVDILAQGTASNGAVGSSVAAAKVTGAASLIWAANPNLNYTQVMDILRRTATDLNAPGWDTQTGLGLLNIAAAVHLAKATEPETYKPANFALVEDTLKTYGIPEVYWKDFYNLYYYYDLEAKMTGAAWSGTGSFTATERAALSFSNPVATVVTVVTGDPTTGILAGVLAGNSGGGSGGGSGGDSFNAYPQWAKNLVSSTKTLLNSAKSVLTQVSKDTKQALKNGETYFGQTIGGFVSSIEQSAGYVRNQFDDGWGGAGRAGSSMTNVLKNGWDSVEHSGDYLKDKGKQAWNRSQNAVNSALNWVSDAWNEATDAAQSVQNSVNKGWQTISEAADQVGEKIPKSIDELKKLGKNVNNFLNENNPVGKLANDLAAKLKSNLKGIDVAAILNILKQIPVVGTAVSGLEGLYYLAQGDWQNVLTAAINAALGFYGASSVVKPDLVKLFVDVAWELKDGDYKGAVAAALSNFKVERDLADTFVNVAWATKDGDWKSVLRAGLSTAKFNNADKFVNIAWGVVEGNYQNALNTGLEMAGLDKLGLNPAKADAFVKSALALRDNQPDRVEEALLSIAGQQFANSPWVQALKDTNPDNDRAAVTEGLLAAGFQKEKVEQWVNMAWQVKNNQYLDALSTGFSLGGFTQGKDWIAMARNLQQKEYLDALSTGFKISGFKKGENLVKAAVAVQEGNPINAFFNALSLVDGVGELVDAFKYLKDGNAKQGVPLMIKAAPKLGDLFI